MRLRRPLGLGSALYAGSHFLAFVGLDYQFDLALLRPAVVDQPFVLVGTAAGLILLLLSITSITYLRRRLGRFRPDFDPNCLTKNTLLAGAGIIAMGPQTVNTREC